LLPSWMFSWPISDGLVALCSCKVQGTPLGGTGKARVRAHTHTSLILENMRVTFTQEAESNLQWTIIPLIKQQKLWIYQSLIKHSIPGKKFLTVKEIKKVKDAKRFLPTYHLSTVKLQPAFLLFFFFRKIFEILKCYQQ
jgi:hypothetical protein